MNKKARPTGMTLVELQVAVLLLTVVLIATGVVFYFALNSIRFLQDAWLVQTNANAVLKAVKAEVMRANRYGWFQLEGWGVDEPPDGSIYCLTYGTESDCRMRLLPSVCDGVAYIRWPDVDPYDPDDPWLTSPGAACLYLRQDRRVPDEATGTFTPEIYHDDRLTLFYFYENDGINTTPQLIMAWDDNPSTNSLIGDFGMDPSANSGRHLIIADHVRAVQFELIDFNCVGMTFTIRGDIPDPLDSDKRYNEITLRTKFVLRCAPAITCENFGPGGYW